MNKSIEVHDRVKLTRIEKKLSREEVASKLDISVTAYGRIERGGTELSISRLEQLAEIFGVEKDELVGVSSLDTEELLKEVDSLKQRVEGLEFFANWIAANSISFHQKQMTINKYYEQIAAKLPEIQGKNAMLLPTVKKNEVEKIIIEQIKASKFDKFFFAKEELEIVVNQYFYPPHLNERGESI